MTPREMSAIALVIFPLDDDIGGPLSPFRVIAHNFDFGDVQFQAAQFVKLHSDFNCPLELLTIFESDGLCINKDRFGHHFGVLAERTLAQREPTRLAQTIERPWATLFVLAHWGPKCPLTLNLETRSI